MKDDDQDKTVREFFRMTSEDIANWQMIAPGSAAPVTRDELMKRGEVLYEKRMNDIIRPGMDFELMYRVSVAAEKLGIKVPVHRGHLVELAERAKRHGFELPEASEIGPAVRNKWVASNDATHDGEEAKDAVPPHGEQDGR